MSDTEPRCPYCDGPLDFLHGDARQSRIRNAPTDSFVLACINFQCVADICFLGDYKADCVRQATTLKLLARKVREAVDAEREACADVAWEHRCPGHQENCDCSGDISGAIRARKESSRRQPVDK